MFLNPRTVNIGEALGPIDVAVRRNSVSEPPSEVIQIYIENGEAKVASTTVVDRPANFADWVFQYSLGQAVDVAIEFDGSWVHLSNERFRMQTQGEPWLFIVKPTGHLYAQQGQTSNPTLLAEGVSEVAAIRGWRNTKWVDHDQGIVCVYIKDGAVYYRNYAIQPDDNPTIWELERLVDTLPAQVSNLSVFRTIDYRVGVMCESEEYIWWTVSDRNWAGMAIADHTISVRPGEVSINFIDITYHEGRGADHTINAAGTVDLVSMLYAASYYKFIQVSNDGPTTIHTCCPHYLTDLDAIDFCIVDSMGAIFNTADISGDGRNLTLTVDNLNYSAEGDLTLKFLGSGNTKGEIGQDVDPFELDFTPEGLEYVTVDPPVVEVIWNE